MKIRYENHQDKSDPLHRTVITEASKLTDWLNSARKQVPFLARLSGDNGFELMIGIGLGLGWTQYSRSDGDPPYLVALSNDHPVKTGYVEFLTANTPTTFPARNILSFDELKQIVLHFLATGERSDSFSWEPI